MNTKKKKKKKKKIHNVGFVIGGLRITPVAAADPVGLGRVPGYRRFGSDKTNYTATNLLPVN